MINLPEEIGDLGLQIKPFMLPLILGGLSVGSILLAFILLYSTVTTHEAIEFIEGGVGGESGGGVTPQSASLNKITVDVAGGVKTPGVYKITQGARIEDAIAAAGGLSADASTVLLEKVLNRAAKVSDGAKVYIPKKSDEDTSHNLVPGGEVSSDITSHNNNTDQTRGAGIVSINTASQAQLEELPGVGPVTAGKIISGRPYTNLQELQSRKVINTSIFERIQDQISL